MPSLDDDLNQRLTELHGQSLYRRLRRVDSPQTPHIQVEGESLLNFSSNDYLGLANEPSVKQAAQEALAQFGAGSGASRLICGSLKTHHQLEETLAEFKNTQAAITFSSGYATAIGTMDALLDKGDIVVLDELAHGCLVDAARLCRAKLRVFPHNDLDQLETILKWADQPHSWAPVGHRPRKLIVTESVFSMDGDLAPLRDIVRLKETYGAWLLLDEAHATGLFGENRRGLAEACDVADQVDLQMGTLGKALGSAGGYICGSETLVQFLINKARTFIFSTAPTPATAAAATASIAFVRSSQGEERRTQLWNNVDQIKNGLIKNQWPLPPVRSAIIPLVVGEETEALRLAEHLRTLGIYIPAIRYPTVARATARLRLTLTATHSQTDLDSLITACTPQPSLPAHKS